MKHVLHYLFLPLLLIAGITAKGQVGPAGINSGIEFWYDGSNVNNAAGTNPSDSTRLGTWKDISGNGNDARVLPGLDTPWVRSSQINGKDVVGFKRTSDVYGTVYVVDSVDIRSANMPQTTIFTVYRPGTHGTAELQGLWGADNGDWDRFFMPVYNGNNGVVAVGPGAEYVGVTNAGVTGTTRLLTAVYDHGVTNGSTIYFNAVPVTTVTDDTDPSAAQTNFRIGWDGDNNTYQGDIAEMVLYNRKLTDCEIKAVNRYFGYKYGVTFTSATVIPAAPQYICSTDSVLLTASTGPAHQWLKDGAVIGGATSATYYAKTNGNYQVVIGTTGCLDTSMATVVTTVSPVVYVDSSISVSGDGSSWSAAKKTLREALIMANQVSCPTQVWVKKGTYYPTPGTNRDSSFIISRNNLKVYGGFAGTETAVSGRVAGNTTILSGDIGTAGVATDNSYHVVRVITYPVTAIDTSTVLDGFTISDGTANGTSSSGVFGGYVIYNNWGGGIYMFCNGAGYSCRMQISSCIFSHNTSTVHGGAITFDGFQGTLEPQITDCSFSNNTAANQGGATVNSYSSVTYKNCTFTANTAAAAGGAMMQEGGGTLSLSNSMFSGNTGTFGGAIRIAGGDPVVKLNSNIFLGNTATSNDGGALSLVMGNGKDTLINNLFVKNKATGSGGNGGGAIVQENATSSYIVNNTFYADTAASNAGAIYFKSAGTNRFLYNNVFSKNYNGTALTDTALEAGTAISGRSNNLFSNTDALFVNEANPIGADNTWRTSDDGLHLLPCSAAVDSGLNSAIGTVAKDIKNATRIQHTFVDMGAYEQDYAGTGRPKITLAANPDNKICLGDPTGFDATKKGTGTAPTYKWYKNGTLVSTSATYFDPAPANKDSFWVVLTNTDCNLSDTSNKVIMVVTPPVIYVDSSKASSGDGTSWTTAYKTVQEALYLAHAGADRCPTQIWVRKGTYYPTTTTNRDSTFRITKSGIKLYGGFAGTETTLGARSVSANPTILSGDIGVANDSTDNSYHVMVMIATAASQIDTTTTVDGFTITRGNGQFGGSFNYGGIVLNHQDGGGIELFGPGTGNKCTPVIANCTFSRNSANYGGAIYTAGFNSGGNCSPILRKNTFTYNKANNLGGAMFCNGQNSGNSSPVIDSCTFSNNTAGGGNGGAVHCQATGSGNSKTNISNSSFNENTATQGGAISSTYAQLQITNCVFLKNTTTGSGGAIQQEGGTNRITNNLFQENSATAGGSVRMFAGDPVAIFTNNVFYKNQSRTNDGGAISMVLGNGKDTLINNLFVQNKAINTGINGGGAFVQESGTSSYIVNNTFYADSATSLGGAIYFKSGGTNRFLYNNIFYKNYNGTAASDVLSAAGTAIAGQSNNMFSSTDPMFVNEANPIGADNIWRSSDDGLYMSRCSEAINGGLNSAVLVATDIANATRIQFTKVDRGAYEHNFDSTGKPKIAIAANPGNKVCQGTSVSFPVTAAGGGTSATYSWYKNGSLVSSTATYSSTTLETNDTVWVVLRNPDCNLSDTSNRIVMTVTPPVLYVDSAITASGNGTTWAKAFKTLNEALNVSNATPASCAVQVWVKKGTYYPTAGTARDSSFRVLRNNIKVYGGFAGTETVLTARSAATNATILSGDIGTKGDSTDNSYHIMTIAALRGTVIDTNVVVDGFTITKANASGASIGFTVNGQTFFHHDGGGIYNLGYGAGSECSPKINDCKFLANTSYYGSALYNGGSDTGKSNPLVSNCLFEDNYALAAAGAILNQARFSGLSSPVFTNTIFRRNGSPGNGGAVYDNGSSTGSSSASFTNCQFLQNYTGNVGGAVFAAGSTGLTNNPSFTSCTFTNNTSDYGTTTITRGGAIYTSVVTGMTLTDCIFTGNTSRSGGGAITMADASTATLNRVVFSANSAVSGTGGAVQNLNNNSTATTITNCLFVNNTANGTTDNGGGAVANTGGTVSLLNTTVFGNTTTSTTRANANSFSSAAGTTTTLTNTIVWGAAATHMDMLGTVNYVYSLVKGAALTAPSLSTDPRFVRPSNPIGADGIWLTADDGLELLPCSPAVNTATTAPTQDIRKRARFGLPDMGAYEEQTGNVPTLPTVTTPVVYCQNATPVVLTATKTSATDTLKWYNAVPALLPGAPTPGTTDTGTTIYYVSQTNILGCESAKAMITVRVNSTPVLPTTTTPVTYCQGIPAVALSATSALPADTLKWYNSTPTLLSGAPTPSTATPGTTTYYVSSKNSFGCESPKKTISVVVNATPLAPVAPSPVAWCQDDAATALTAKLGTTGDTLKWFNATPTLLGTTAPVPSTTTPGSTTYYVSEKTPLGCEGPKSTIIVTINPKPAAPAVITPINACIGVIPPALTATGTNLKWYTVATGGTGTPTLIPKVSSTGITTYYVSQTTAFGCEGPRSALSVNVRPSPIVTVAPVNAPAFVFCHDDSITIKASSLTAISYQWYRNAVTMPGSTLDSITISTTADYGVIVKDIYGCADTETVKVIQNPLPVPTLSPTDVYLCDGVDIMLYARPAAPGYFYVWMKDGMTMGLPATTSQTPVRLSGTYSVIVTDIYNCMLTTNTASVITYPVLTAPVINRTGSVLRVTTTYATYQWYRNGKAIPGANARSYTMSFDGDYHVVVSDANGCIATSDVYTTKGLGIVQVTSRSIKLFPNPSSAIVNIEADMPVNVRVTDVTGKLLLEQKEATSLDLAPFADGMYLFTITDKDGLPVLVEKVNKISSRQ